MLLMMRRLPQMIRPMATDWLFRSASRAFATTQCLWADRHYTSKHEWVVVDGDIATVGITNYAQEALGDIVYAELPEVGRDLVVGDAAAAVESVKAASDVYSPIGGTVTEKNIEVEKDPSLINKSAFDNGWLFKLKVKDVNELKSLMDEDAYDEYQKTQEEVAH